MDVQGRVDCCIQVVTFMVLRGMDKLHIVAAPWHVQHWGIEKVGGKLFALQRCTGDHELEWWVSVQVDMWMYNVQ